MRPRRSVLELRSGQLRYRGQRRLGGVEAEEEVLVREGGVQVGRLVPVRIPAAPICVPRSFSRTQIDGTRSMKGVESVFVM